MLNGFALMGGGLVLLYVGAEALVRSSVAVANRLGVSTLLVGLTVVAIGTSLPEALVSLNAAWQGHEELALGNVIGSNIANLALVLGLSAIIRPIPIQSRRLRTELLFMLGASVVFFALLHDHNISHVEGGVLLLALGGYFFVQFVHERGNNAARMNAAISENKRVALKGWHLLGIGVGVVCLQGGAHLMIEGATGLASVFEIETSVVGLTLVAVSTSIPEIATCTVAAFHGEGEMLLGNIVGSNIFNILGIVGLTGLLHPLSYAGMTMTSSIIVMVGAPVLLAPLLWKSIQVGRSEGLWLVGIYIIYSLVVFA